MKQFIECPECNTIQLATVDTSTIPWNTLIHHCEECEKCEYVIMESEWNPLKAISIKQPWAWLIVNGYKDLENRATLNSFRGKVLIHASLKPDYDIINTDNDHIYKVLEDNDLLFDDDIDAYCEVGGIIGAVTITDSITESDSPWFSGPNAFVLTNAVKLPFTPCKGKLGFFNPKID